MHAGSISLQSRRIDPRWLGAELAELAGTRGDGRFRSSSPLRNADRLPGSFARADRACERRTRGTHERCGLLRGVREGAEHESDVVRPRFHTKTSLEEPSLEQLGQRDGSDAAEIVTHGEGDRRAGITIPGDEPDGRAVSRLTKLEAGPTERAPGFGRSARRSASSAARRRDCEPKRQSFSQRPKALHGVMSSTERGEMLKL